MAGQVDFVVGRFQAMLADGGGDARLRVDSLRDGLLRISYRPPGAGARCVTCAYTAEDLRELIFEALASDPDVTDVRVTAESA
jgi:hypothetical protein